MPKLKTNKAVAKKIRITGKGKAFRLYAKQNHFNSRETGDFGRMKKRERRLSKTDEHNVINALPYN